MSGGIFEQDHHCVCVCVCVRMVILNVSNAMSTNRVCIFLYDGVLFLDADLLA